MRPIILAGLLSAALAAPGAAGPPFLTVEFRPIGAEALMVRSYHRGQPSPTAPTGTAEGLVGGRRVSIPLTFQYQRDDRAFVVARVFPDSGVWVLTIALAGEHGDAGAVAGFDRRGEPAFVRFPRHATGTTRPATPAEVDALLRSLDAGAPTPALRRTGWGVVVLRTVTPIAFLAVLTLGPAYLLLRARDRRRARLAARAA